MHSTSSSQSGHRPWRRMFASPASEGTSRVFDAQDCALGDEALPALLARYHEGARFEEMLLRYNALTHRCLGDLRPYMAPTLSVLDLSGNAIGAPGVKTLSECARDAWCELRYLNLRETGLEPKATSHLVKLLPLLPQLRTLVLSNNRLGQGIQAVCKRIPTACPKLAHLRLSHMQLEAADAGAVAAFIEACPALQALDVSGNVVIGAAAEGAAALRALGRSAALESLNAAHVGLCAGNLAALADGLRGRTALGFLNLSGNALWDLPGGPRAVCGVLEGLPALAQLQVGSNRVYNADLPAFIADGLAHTRGLEFLSLASNKLVAPPPPPPQCLLP